MNSKFKKGALALGTIATIAAPVAAVISCGATNSINWSDDDTYAGVKAQEFLNQIKHLGKTKQNAITVGREQMMELQYQSESIRSIKAQAEDFRYQQWQIKMDNGKLTNDMYDVLKEQHDYTGTDDDIKKGFTDRIDAINKSTDDNDEKTKKIDGYLAAIKKVTDVVDTSAEYIADKNDVVANFYKNDYNATDYPEVYKSLEVIHGDKQAIVADAYKNFYPSFDTKAEGDREWPKELAAQYGNAATFNQAIDYLVNQEISAKAFNSYKFEINKSFTVEKKLWAQYIDDNKDKDGKDDKAWKFLVKDDTNDIAGSVSSEDIKDDIAAIVGTKTGDDQKLEIEENILLVNKGEPIGSRDVKTSVLSSPELFLGSTSPDHRVPSKAMDKLGKVVKYQHLLIKATQGKTPEELWTIKADDFKKLMEFDQYAPDTKTPGTTEISQGIDLLQSAHLFDDGDTDFTDFVLKAISGNSAGTLKTQGSLGVKSEIEYLKAMVPGFSLGALSITQGGTDAVTTLPTLDLSDLIKKLRDALNIEIKKDYGIDITTKPSADDIDTYNTDIDAVITALGDEKVKTIFGKVFEEFFKDKKGLVYQLGGGNTPSGMYLVISQFGIHIIKRNHYDDGDTIRGELTKDLNNMAKDSTLSSTTSISDELNSYFSDSKVMETLIGEDYFKDTKPTTDTPYVAALKAKLDEYNKDKTDDIDKVTFENITDVITSVNLLADKTAVDGAIGDKLENWLVSQLDVDLRTLTEGSTTVKLSDIYTWVQNAQTTGGKK